MTVFVLTRIVRRDGHPGPSVVKSVHRSRRGAQKKANALAGITLQWTPVRHSSGLSSASYNDPEGQVYLRIQRYTLED